MAPAPKPRKRTRDQPWGSVARHGAREVAPPPEDPRNPRPRRTRVEREHGPPPAWEPELWVEERDPQPVRRQAKGAVARGGGWVRQGQPRETKNERPAAVGNERAPDAERRLRDARRALERDRYGEVVRLLRPLGDGRRAIPGVRELLGLAAYRQGKWADAARHLEAYRTLTDTYAFHPVLADSYRALGRWDDVAALWEELREASPGAEIVTEGRIVAAGALADQGDVRGAIRLLRKGAQPARPKWFHLRLWYALADLYERAGDVPRARELFGRILERDAAFGDVVERIEALG